MAKVDSAVLRLKALLFLVTFGMPPPQNAKTGRSGDPAKAALIRISPFVLCVDAGNDSRMGNYRLARRKLMFPELVRTFNNGPPPFSWPSALTVFGP